MKSCKLLSQSRYILLVVLFGLIGSHILWAQTHITQSNREIAWGLNVNTFSGNVFFKHQLFSLPTTNMPIQLTLVYNSDRKQDLLGMGAGWMFNYQLGYEVDPSGNVIMGMGDGREVTFNKSGSDYPAPAGTFDTLTVSGDTVRMRQKRGMEFEFADISHKQVTTIRNADGLEMTFTYSGGLLTSISDPFGRTVGLGRIAGKIRTIYEENGSSRRTWVFRYDGDRLAGFSGPENMHYRFRYDAEDRLSQVINPNFEVMDIRYWPNGAAQQIEIPSVGVDQSFVFDAFSLTTTITEIIGGVPQITEYEYDASKRLIRRSGNCCGFNNLYSYDSDNNITAYTNALGQTTTYTYDSRGNLLTQTDPLGGVETYTYDPATNMATSYTDKVGNITTNSYDARGNLISTVFPLGITEHWSYDPLGLLDYWVNGIGDTTYYSFDVFGNPASEIYPDGTSRTFVYDGRGNLLSETDPNGNSTTYTYDDQNRLITETGPAPFSYVKSFVYDNAGNLISERNANGHITSYTYDALGRQIEQHAPEGASTLFSFNQRNLTQITDPNGNTIDFAYDGINRLTSETTSIGTITYGYDGLGNLTSITDPVGGTVTFVYDAERRVLSETDQDGATFTYTYDLAGNRLTQTEPNGNVTTYAYDAAGRRVSTTDNLGQVWVRTYDLEDNIITEADGNNNTTLYTYDKLGRVLTVSDALANTTTYTYDNNGNRLTEMMASGATTTYTYDAINRRSSKTDPLGNVTSYTYDGNNNQLTVTDDNSNVTTYTYDGLDRITSESYANGGTRTYTYDTNGNLISRTDQKGNTTTYTYDAHDRLTVRDYPGTNDDSYTYDAANRMLTASNSNGTTTMTYTAAGLIASESRGGLTTSYSYNMVAGTRTLTYPSGRVITEELDDRSRLDQVKEGASTIGDYSHDLGDRNTTLNYLNGNTSTYTYDAANRITSLVHNNGSDFWDVDYSYDSDHNRLSARRNHRPANSEQYIYDAASRLTDFRIGTLNGSNVITTPTSSSNYTMDGVGNRTATLIDGLNSTYSFNNVNEYTLITGFGGFTPTYDPNGNQTFNGSHYYFYDHENRITTVSTDMAGSNVVASYTYDALDRRISNTNSGTTTQYYYDGQRVIEEREGVNTSTYVYGIMLDHVLETEINGTNYYYHLDGLGSVVSLTDGVGSVVEHYEYDAYGEVRFFDPSFTATGGSVVGNEYLFTGRRLDDVSGLYYYRARHYSAQQGRFMQRDPLGYVDGMNLYEYVGSNPVNYIDPDGKRRWGCSSATCRMRNIIGGIGCMVACYFGIDAELLSTLKNILQSKALKKFFKALKNKNFQRAVYLGRVAVRRAFSNVEAKIKKDSDKRTLRAFKKLTWRFSGLLAKIASGAGTAYLVYEICKCAYCCL